MYYKIFRALLVRKGSVLFLLSLTFVVTSLAAVSHWVYLAASVDGDLTKAELSGLNPTESILRLAIKTNEIEFNPRDNMLYATRPSTAGADGNAVTRIDPLTGGLAGSVYVGSEPSDLAFSENGETMYMVLEGAYS